MILGRAPADVRLTPDSGHKRVWRWMSALTPKADIGGAMSVPDLLIRRARLSQAVELMFAVVLVIEIVTGLTENPFDGCVGIACSTFLKNWRGCA